MQKHQRFAGSVLLVIQFNIVDSNGLPASVSALGSVGRRHGAAAFLKPDAASVNAAAPTRDLLNRAPAALLEPVLAEDVGVHLVESRGAERGVVDEDLRDLRVGELADARVTVRAQAVGTLQ